MGFNSAPGSQGTPEQIEEVEANLTPVESKGSKSREYMIMKEILPVAKENGLTEEDVLTLLKSIKMVDKSKDQNSAHYRGVSVFSCLLKGVEIEFTSPNGDIASVQGFDCDHFRPKTDIAENFKKVQEKFGHFFNLIICELSGENSESYQVREERKKAGLNKEAELEKEERYKQARVQARANLESGLERLLG